MCTLVVCFPTYISCFTCIMTLQVFVKIWMQWSIALSSAIYKGKEKHLWIVFSFKESRRLDCVHVISLEWLANLSGVFMLLNQYSTWWTVPLANSSLLICFLRTSCPHCWPSPTGDLVSTTQDQATWTRKLHLNDLTAMIFMYYIPRYQYCIHFTLTKSSVWCKWYIFRMNIICMRL